MPAGFGHAALLVGGAPMVSATVCTATKLGKSTAAWSAAPLTAYLQEAITPTLKHATYKEGDDAIVTLRNPLAPPIAAARCWCGATASGASLA